MTTRITLTKGEDTPLKEETSPESKCHSKSNKPNSGISTKIMTMPNFTVFIVLVALLSIVGETVLHNIRNHDSIISTDPESLDIIIDESASVIYKYTRALNSSFTIQLNTSKELNVKPNSINFSPNKLSDSVLISGKLLTSRAFVDIQTCKYDQTETPCNFTFTDTFVTVKVAHSRFLSVLITVTGWIYFFAWSISFYPQIVLNFKRKSVHGLHFDFLLLNVIGFTCYSIFNVMMYFDSEVHELYFKEKPRAQIPVLLNDVVFALHALFACIVTGLQCFIYERENQRISYICMGWSSILLLFSSGSLVAAVFKVLDWLRFINYLSYVKFAVTLSKYFPQAILNYRRKSTVGWSIGNILLDFTGGSMDIVQMILQGANTNDWTGFYGNPVKFFLGLVSMIFDIIFMIQHYILYRHSESHDIHHEHNLSAETVVEDTPDEEEEEEDIDPGLYH